jgi:hypothetical protein
VPLHGWEVTEVTITEKPLAAVAVYIGRVSLFAFRDCDWCYANKPEQILDLPGGGYGCTMSVLWLSRRDG